MRLLCAGAVALAAQPAPLDITHLHAADIAAAALNLCQQDDTTVLTIPRNALPELA